MENPREIKNGLGEHSALEEAWREDHSPFRFLFKKSPGPLGLRLLISLPILGLLAEWLLPLRELGSERNYILLKTLFGIACLLIGQGIIPLKGWIWAPLNLYVLLFLWGGLFYIPDPLEWLSYYSYILSQDLQLFGGSWHFSDLSGESRMLVMLVGWGMMISAVHMLALYRRTIWLFGGTTIVYLSILEAGMEISVGSGIYRAAGYLLLVQGWMLLLKLMNEGASPDSSGSSRSTVGVLPGADIMTIMRWGGKVCVSAGIVVLLLLAGGSAVRPGAGMDISLSDLVNKLQEWSGQEEGRPVSAPVTLTGYTSLSRDMGGPLTPNPEPVFTVQTARPGYWRGDAFAVYDGRKWVQKELEAEYFEKVKAVDASGDTGLRSGNDITGEPVIQKIMLSDYGIGGMPLFASGTVSKVHEITGYSGKLLEEAAEADAGTGTVRLRDGIYGVTSYTVEAFPQAEAKNLLMDRSPSQEVDPEHIKQTYLQLPDNLPDRVRKLGEELMSQKPGRYEKVLAVEAYLEQDMKYTLKTRMPPAGQDFTDDFLFTSKEGYCSHFATAFAVLLRTQGIPARYVVGYAPGTKVQDSDHTYLVTGEEAHAWTEVYFPGAGWVAFDPTPGFDAGETVDAASLNAASKDNITFANLVKKMQMALQSGVQWFTKNMTMLSILAGVLIIPLLWIMIRYAFLALRGNIKKKKDSVFSEETNLFILKSAGVWGRIQKKYGPMAPGVTVKKYMQSIHIQDDVLRREIEDFAGQWERAAYANSFMSRSEKVRFLRKCRELSRKLA